jgi:hypothetical protein
MWPQFSTTHLKRLVIPAILLLGIVFRTVQLLSGRSIWMDEAWLALNLLNRDFAGLLQPLDLFVVAPPMFLWIEKCIILTIGPTDLAFRLFPYICSIISLFFFNILLDQLQVKRNVRILSILFFALLPALIYFGSELKQYCPDLAIALGLFVFANKEYSTTRKRVLVLILMGFSVFLSHASVIVLVAIFFVECLRVRKQDWKILVPVFVSWSLIFGFFYIIFFRHHPSSGLLVEYWNTHFLPLNPFTSRFWAWLQQHAFWVFGDLLEFNAHIKTKGIPYVLFLLGLYGITRKGLWKKYLILLLPVLIHLLFSAIKIYPFYHRFLLYLLPAFILITVEGIWLLNRWLKTKLNLVFIISALLIVINLLSVCYKKFPIPNTGIKEQLQFMNEEFRAGDKVIVGRNFLHPLEYYRTIGFTSVREDLMIDRKNTTIDYSDITSDWKGRVWYLFGQPTTRGEAEYWPFLAKQFEERSQLIHSSNNDNASLFLFHFDDHVDLDSDIRR